MWPCIVTNFFIIKPTDALISQIYFGLKLYMFRTVPLSIIRSFRAGPGWNWVPSWSCSKVVYKPVWHIPLLSLQWIKSWWWTEELCETCRVSSQNKFVKLVRVVGFIIKKNTINMFVFDWSLPRAVIEIKLNKTNQRNALFYKLIFNF
jgi:hypothetical protein